VDNRKLAVVIPALSVEALRVGTFLIGAAGTLWLYAEICVLDFIFIFFKLPETKGKTLEQIEWDLVD